MLFSNTNAFLIGLVKSARAESASKPKAMLVLPQQKLGGQHGGFDILVIRIADGAIQPRLHGKGKKYAVDEGASRHSE